MANAYFEKGEYRKALPLLEQLAKSYPNDEQVKQKLAQARAGCHAHGFAWACPWILGRMS